MKIYTLFPLIALSGCQTTQPVAVDIAPLSAQIERLTEANLQLDRLNHDLDIANGRLAEENGRLLAQIRADAEAGRAANGKGWLAFEGYVWDQQILRLPDIIADAPTEARWGEAATLYQAGGESAMQGVIDDLHEDAATLNGRIGELTEAAEQAAIERDRAKEAADAALRALKEQESLAASAAEQARLNERRAIMEAQVAWANKWGGYTAIAAILAGVGIYWLGEGAIAACIGLSVSSMLLFGYARFLNWPHYDWVVGGVLAIGIVAGIAYLRRVSSHKKIAKTVNPFAVTLVDVINEADKDARGTKDEAVLDRLIFDRIKEADKTGKFDVIRHELETEKAKIMAGSNIA